jgi:hypothetical protein
LAVTFGCVLSQTIYGPSAGPEAIRTLAQQAEALGFHSLWLADHIVIPRRVQSSYPYAADGASPFDPEQPFYEPLSVLNFLAGCTERFRLGTHAILAVKPKRWNSSRGRWCRFCLIRVSLNSPNSVPWRGLRLR